MSLRSVTATSTTLFFRIVSSKNCSWRALKKAQIAPFECERNSLDVSRRHFPLISFRLYKTTTRLSASRSKRICNNGSFCQFQLGRNYFNGSKVHAKPSSETHQTPDVQTEGITANLLSKHTNVGVVCPPGAPSLFNLDTETLEHNDFLLIYFSLLIDKYSGSKRDGGGGRAGGSRLSANKHITFLQELGKGEHVSLLLLVTKLNGAAEGSQYIKFKAAPVSIFPQDTGDESAVLIGLP